MRLHSKPYSYETEIRSSDGKSRSLHISQVRRLGSLLQLARKSHDFDGRIVYTFLLPASLVDVLLALIDKQAVLIAALASFSNNNAYILIENFKKMGVQPAWMFKLLDAYFTRCSDEDCVVFWRAAKEFNYAIGEKLAFRRLLYTVVPQVLSDTIHENFFDISADNLIELLKDDKLNVHGAESKLIEVIDMWVQKDVENRDAARPLLLSYVRKQGLQEIKEKTEDMLRDELLFNTTSPPREPRDRLLYIGGWNIHSASTKQYFFDKLSGEWQLAAIPKLPLKLCGFVSVMLESTIYVIGGYARKKPTSVVYSLEVREDLPLKWVQRACLNQRRFSHAACVLGGVIYTVGGLEFINHGAQLALRHVECYDQFNNQWKVLRQMHSPRSEMAIAAGNGRIYVAGGRNDHGVILSTVEMYHPDNDVWIDVVALPEPRKAASMFFDGRSLLVAGGFTDANMVTNKVIRWSPETFSWHDHSTLNLGRVKMASIIHEEKIYLIGGRTSASDVRGTTVVEVFDGKENCWMFDSTLRYPRQGGFLVVVPDSADLILCAMKKPQQNRLQSQEQSHRVNSDESVSESDIEHRRGNHSSQSSISETSNE